MTDNQPTRRELRDRERAIQERLQSEQFLNQQPAVVVPPPPAAIAPVAPAYQAPIEPPLPPVLSPRHGRRAAEVAPVAQPEPAPYTPPPVAYQPPVPTYVPEPVAPPAPVVYTPDPTSTNIPMPNDGTIPMIPVAREIDTNTNSIVMRVVPTLENTVILVKPADEQTRLIRTGSIELPPLPSITGEIEVIRAAKEADSSLEAAITGSNPIAIEPQPARGHIRKKRQQVFPGKLATGRSSVHTVLATGIIMATVGTLFLTAYMLHLI